VKYFTLFILLIACSRSDNKIKLKRAWDHYNHPKRMGLNSSDYDFKLEQLPLEAHLSTKPWSGDYWPSYKGGISYRWNHPSFLDEQRIYYTPTLVEELHPDEIKYLSPSEKYDLILGNKNYDFTKKERRRTKIMDSSKTIPRWHGLCHAWSAATLFFAEPSPVEIKTKDNRIIPLGSSDIKALLTYFLHKNAGHSYFVSKRCNINDKLLHRKLDQGLITPETYYEKMNSAECRGINAGSFHIIISNLIGLRDKGFLFDRSRGSEVWNQAAHGYKSKVVDKKTDSFVGNPAPGTTTQIKIQTTLYYTCEVSMSWEKNSPYIKDSKKAAYTYWLELNANKEIIGGTWVSEKRPDFLWSRTIPKMEKEYQLVKNIYDLAISKNKKKQLDDTSDLKEIQIRKQQTRFSSKIYLRANKINPKIKKVYIHAKTKEGRVLKKKKCYISNNGKIIGKITLNRSQSQIISIVTIDSDNKKKEQGSYSLENL
jgi:hypothetical protein